MTDGAREAPEDEKAKRGSGASRPQGQATAQPIVTGPCSVAFTSAPPAAGFRMTWKGPVPIVTDVAVFVPLAVLTVKRPFMRTCPGPSICRAGMSKWMTTPGVVVRIVWL